MTRYHKETGGPLPAGTTKVRFSSSTPLGEGHPLPEDPDYKRDPPLPEVHDWRTETTGGQALRA